MAFLDFFFEKFQICNYYFEVPFIPKFVKNMNLKFNSILKSIFKRNIYRFSVNFILSNFSLGNQVFVSSLARWSRLKFYARWTGRLLKVYVLIIRLTRFYVLPNWRGPFFQFQRIRDAEKWNQGGIDKSDYFSAKWQDN